MFENSKWIAYVENGNDDGSQYLRKSFRTEKNIKQAKLYCCALGYGIFTVNGNTVTDDVLTTSFTRFDKRVEYNTYDVTDLIVPGENVIGAFIGNGWYNDNNPIWDFDKAIWRSHPKMIIHMELICCSGEKIIIESDSSWKGCKGPAVYNHAREGEIYDARIEKRGWNTREYDAKDWLNAVVCRPPGGKLVPSDIEPVRIVRTLNSVYLGNGIYDFGENISGWAHIKIKAHSGHEIKMTYAEIYKNGDIDNNHITMFIKSRLKHQDIYIAGSEHEEEFNPHFVYHGFRYVKVENPPEFFEITAHVVHTDLKTIGVFSCDNDMINKIHEASVRSTLTNYHSIPTDCPHREQNGWTGDALFSSHQALMNFDIVRAYKKWLEDFKDVQRSSGQLPGIIPTSGWGFNWGSGPAWDSVLVHLPWYIYQVTGDSSAVSQTWENSKLYMTYMHSMAEDYVVDYGLGDWAALPSTRKCPSAVTDTAYYYSNACIMEKCAQLMSEDSIKYRELAKKIRNSWRSKFMKEDFSYCQTYYACGLYQQMFNKDEIPQMAAKLNSLVVENGYHIDCGVLGTKYIFTALSENGYAETLYKMITNTEMPSYAFWINNGMTTFCESWRMSDSRNHHMFSEVDYWFYKYIAGIRIDENGLEIKPQKVSGVNNIYAKTRDIEVVIDSQSILIKTRRAFVFKGKEYALGEYRFEL